MRHRAHRSVLARLRPLARTRAAVATAVLLLGALATGIVLTADGPSENAPSAGQAPPTDPGASYDPPTPTATGSPAADRSPRPSAEAAPSSTPSLRATEGPVSRSADRGTGGPTPQDPASSDVPNPNPTPTETPTSEPTPADAPQTTATTRKANAARWVIGVGSDSEATYECSLDGGAFQPCGSTVTYGDLAAGTHSFAARATDGDGDTDPSPATLTTEVRPRGQE